MHHAGGIDGFGEGRLANGLSAKEQYDSIESLTTKVVTKTTTTTTKTTTTATTATTATTVGLLYFFFHFIILSLTRLHLARVLVLHRTVEVVGLLLLQ